MNSPMNPQEIYEAAKAEQAAKAAKEKTQPVDVLERFRGLDFTVDPNGPYTVKYRDLAVILNEIKQLRSINEGLRRNEQSARNLLEYAVRAEDVYKAKTDEERRRAATAEQKLGSLQYENHRLKGVIKRLQVKLWDSNVKILSHRLQKASQEAAQLRRELEQMDATETENGVYDPFIFTPEDEEIEEYPEVNEGLSFDEEREEIDFNNPGPLDINSIAVTWETIEKWTRRNRY